MLTAAENANFEKAFAEQASAGGMASAAAGSPKDIFCQYWQYCVLALEALSQLVGNVIVKAAIKTIITAGNILQQQICR